MMSFKKMGLLASTLLVSQMIFADKVKLLENNHEALQARVDLIQNAKREILVDTLKSLAMNFH